jgi:hypothetical protein
MLGAFKNHQNCCSTSKSELSAVVAGSKEALAARKAKKALRNSPGTLGQVTSEGSSHKSVRSASKFEIHTLNG